ncbi:uncharacterized protein LOC124640422 [Helicoverpa zea]|uniref:uncharacterized protein LOC124640422 n=1 Tax=Helicoverpa zea TaxID=7113 RepID=UPI001F56E5DA|nr:uncharacterized protein LOC124640422 [Helicoverpa zea]
MNSKGHRCCGVPQCKNTSKTTPDKLFVYVPHNKKIRNKWLKLARRDSKAILPRVQLYFCEDHFDLPNDMDNYMEYHVMGSVSQIRMKPGCMPTKFQCQPDRRKRTSDATPRPYIVKKQRKTLIEEYQKDLEEISTKQVKLEEMSCGTSASQAFIGNILQENTLKTVDKSIQVYMTYKFRSKAIQTKANLVNQMTSPLKPSRQSVSTSPFKIKSNIAAKPSISNVQKLLKKHEESDSDISYTPSVTHRDTSPSTISLQMKSTSDCSELIEEDKKQVNSKILELTILKITNNPRFYIGVPKNCFYLINLIAEKLHIPVNHVLMCLRKIRLNNPFRELADDFSMDPTYASKIFLRSIPLIASIMRPFLVKLDKHLTKINLPMAFRHKYHNVSCIKDCLEIEVQKPSKALNQSLSWSEYKKANTIKYLVSCTPNGLVNYISPGYGGRITDTCLVESCDFIKCLQPGMCVMADRGFKHVEPYLRKQGVQLVRPPSVTTGSKLSKNEARETKKIASLRIHVERVIRRLREFNMLKPHACINSNLVKVLDDVITIACCLINLQDSLIK